MAELPSCGEQRGVIVCRACGRDPRENDIEQAVAAKGHETASCTVQNDLEVAAEIELGQGSGTGLQVVYPEASVKLAGHSVDDTLQIFVRLRDDIRVKGMCTVQGSTLQLSKDFGEFGPHARKQIQQEKKEAEQESHLRRQRQFEIRWQLYQEVTKAVARRQKVATSSIAVCLLMVFAAMVACTAAAFSATELQGLGLAVALLGLICCACGGWGGLLFAGAYHDTEMLEAVQAARPELQRFYDPGSELHNCNLNWRNLTVWSCGCCVPLVVLGCMAAMTVASCLNGYGWASAVLWGPAPLMMYCGGVVGWRIAAERDAGWGERAGVALVWALIFPIFWPFVLEGDFPGRIVALLLKPHKGSLDAAVDTTHDHTIVFEGNVLPGRETVSSWPGKYATAWDTLVAGSRQDDISAAVVFLPEGSKHFGLHDPIPWRPDLQDLHGECWCTPLYGERKPWGCRWWSKWIGNIEQAASQGCTLAVYYFNNKKGQGKVKDFTTAGEEHMRREAIERRKDAFLKSEGFCNALEAGLKHLPKEKGPDSSSPYSREVHRLFLAWLPEEDRDFLVSSEGLGNSQKAEVAWLERNGYSYIEKEVSELESLSHKAIGQATE